MATKKTDITVVKSSDLERNLGRTITNNFYKYIDNFMMAHLSDKGDNFIIQSLSPMLEDLPQLKEKLVDLYNKTFGMEKKVNDIPDDVKAIQGALLDGLVFAYDIDKQALELYTMNSKLLYGMETNVEFVDKKVIDKNVVGQYKAFRIDVTYKEGSKTFEFKAVNHRKVLDGDTIFIPYLSVLRGMKLIEHFLDNGNVLKTVQNVAGVQKLRVVTKSKHVLSEFCDDPEVSQYLTCEYFPLTGSMYLPVVGAPSTTAMMTSIKICQLDNISKCKSMASIAKLGIYKETNPVRTLIAEHVIVSKLEEMRRTSPDEYTALLDKLPRNDYIFNGDTQEGNEVTPFMVTKYLHQLSKSEIEEVYKLVPGALEAIGFRSSMMEQAKVVYKREAGAPPISKGEVYDLLKNNICKILCRSSSCKLSSAVGTNNPKFLAKFYGKDYFGKYESLGARCSAFLDEVKMGRPVEACCEDYCIDFNAFSEISKTPEYNVNDSDGFKALYAKKMGIRTRSASSSTEDSPVLNVRQCFATRTEDGTVTDYYRSVDTSQILQIWVLSDAK